MFIQVVRPSVHILTPPGVVRELIALVEQAGRTCYKSEGKIRDGSAERFIGNIVRSGHESVIEHACITARFICDRACSHQLVRHRLAAYSQESQRYCDYSARGLDSLQVICAPTIADLPVGYYTYHHTTGADGVWVRITSWVEEGFSYESVIPVQEEMGKGQKYHRVVLFLQTVENCYRTYKDFREVCIPAEDARSLLPNAVKTEVVATYNLRTWRHIIQERGLNPHAQWQIRGLFRDALRTLNELLPFVFGDLMDKVKD